MAKIEQKNVINHLELKWKNRSCPMCQSGPWQVMDSTFQLTEFNESNVILGGPVVPVIPVVCGNCGYVALVSAIAAGVQAKSIQPEAKGQPK